MPAAEFAVERIGDDFFDWPDLLDLIRGSFAYMDPLIDPPSSALKLTAQSLRQKARDEIAFIARDGAALAGCIFCRPEAESLYIGKLAIASAFQRQGIGRRLVNLAADLARERGMPGLRLQTRIELTGNHRAFAAMGFVRTGLSAHAGYDWPTTVEMFRTLAIAAKTD